MPGLSSAAAASGEAAPAARRRGSYLLEDFQNVVTDEQRRRRFEIRKCGCDCWYCRDCCTRKGYNLKAELIGVLRTFTGLMMLTLTIDPELFPSPRTAYIHMRKRRGVGVLMQDLRRAGCLHSSRYFYVVEFQEDTEQAHIHLLIDATYVPKPLIDNAWSKLRPRDAGPVAANRPAFGMTRFSKRDFEGGPAHAAGYLVKYLVKLPPYGLPKWVRDSGGDIRVPRYRASRGFWGREPQPKNPSAKKRTAARRSYAERIADCGTTSNVFYWVESVSTESGEVVPSRSWLARVGVGLPELEGLDGERQGPRRIVILHRSLSDCLGALEAAAGHPVRVLAGVVPPGGAR